MLKARLCRAIAILCALILPSLAMAQQTPPAISLAVTSSSSYTALPAYGAPNNPYALFVNDGIAELTFALGQAGKTPPVVGTSTGPQQASFTASLSGTTMTVTAVTSGTIGLNQIVSGTGITPGTTISALGTGTGGTGTYTLSAGATTEPAEPVLAFSPLPTIEAGGCRVINVGTAGGYVAAATVSGSTTLRVTTQLAGPTSPSCPGPGSSGIITGTVTSNQGTSPWVNNVTQFGSNPVVTGTGASGVGIPRVTVSSDSTVGLIAGTALVGKVGIDQTTPGTTNGVVVNSSALPTGAALDATLQSILTKLNASVAVTGTFWQATQPISAASLPLPTGAMQQSGGTVGLVAGSAIAGKFGIDQTTPGTTNGVVVAPTSASAAGITPVVSASAEGSHVLKASAGNLYSLYVTTGATAGYVMTFNATSAPADGAVTPTECVQVAAASTVGLTFSSGPPDVYSTGITAVFSSTGCFTKTVSATAFFKGRVQ